MWKTYDKLYSLYIFIRNEKTNGGILNFKISCNHVYFFKGVKNLQ